MNYEVTISEGCNKINVNWIYENKKINGKIYNLFFYLLSNYEVADPGYFLDLIIDSIDKDNKERNVESEIINYYPYFYNGKIINYRQFKMILDYYASKREDKNIYKVPWNDLISFNCRVASYDGLSDIWINIINNELSISDIEALHISNLETTLQITIIDNNNNQFCSFKYNPNYKEIVNYECSY